MIVFIFVWNRKQNFTTICNYRLLYYSPNTLFTHCHSSNLWFLWNITITCCSSLGKERKRYLFLSTAICAHLLCRHLITPTTSCPSRGLDPKSNNPIEVACCSVLLVGYPICVFHIWILFCFPGCS